LIEDFIRRAERLDGGGEGDQRKELGEQEPDGARGLAVVADAIRQCRHGFAVGVSSDSPSSQFFAFW